jgi:hypothetical protein
MMFSIKSEIGERGCAASPSLPSGRVSDASSKKSETSGRGCAASPSLPKELRAIILDYAAEWQLVDWIHMEEIDWYYLGENPHPGATELMMKNLDCVDWHSASDNANMWPYLKDHSDLIDSDSPFKPCFNTEAHIIPGIDLLVYWPGALSDNPIMVPWLTKNPEYIDWDALSRNEAARELVLANLDKISWGNLHRNTAPWAIELLEKNPRWHHGNLAANPAGFDLLMDRAARSGMPIDQFINWITLSRNKNPRAIELAMTRKGSIKWEYFSRHEAAIPYLWRNKHKIDWETLSANPGIFRAVWPVGVFELL